MAKRNGSYRIALIGNPNSGKSSLFNALTGLNQKISNYPGVTVDKKVGHIELSSGDKVEIIDFPGIYSLYPNSSDEKIVVETLTNPDDINYPDAIIYVAASQELEKHFLLASQIRELIFLFWFCMTMMDLNERKGISYDLEVLSDYLGTPVTEVSTLKGINIDGLKYKLIELIKTSKETVKINSHHKTALENKAIRIAERYVSSDNDYQKLLVAHHHSWLNHLSAADRIQLSSEFGAIEFNSTRAQINETLSRYNSFTPIIEKASIRSKSNKLSLTERIDNIITPSGLRPFDLFWHHVFPFSSNLFPGLPHQWIGSNKDLPC